MRCVHAEVVYDDDNRRKRGEEPVGNSVVDGYPWRSPKVRPRAHYVLRKKNGSERTFEELVMIIGSQSYFLPLRCQRPIRRSWR